MTNCPTCLPIKPKCQSKVLTECVVYSGDYLSTLAVTNGDNLNTILSKIDSFVVSGGGGTETPNSKIDTNSITISLTGTNSRTISASLKVSPTVGNKLVVDSTGVFVGGSTLSQSYDPISNELTTVVDGTTSNIILGDISYTESTYGS